MANWQEWLRLLIALVIIIGFFDMLLPANDIKKLAKLVAGLVLMLAVLQPVLAIVNLNWATSLQEFPNDVVQSSQQQSWTATAEQLSEAGLKPALSSIEASAQAQLTNYLTGNFQLESVNAGISLATDGTIRQVTITGSSTDQLSLEEQQALLANLKQSVASYLQTSENLVHIKLN